MQEASDAEIIARSLAESARFGEIFDRHAATLLRFLVRRAGPEVGGSLLGELFRIAFERRARFDPGRASARPWLYGIATHLLLHQGRSDGRRARATRRIEDHELGRGLVAVEDELVDELDARLLLPRVAAAIRSLPEGEREALLLYAWEDQSYAEIAEALGVPTGTVRSRIHRARARLRETIGSSPNGQNGQGEPRDDRTPHRTPREDAR